MDKRLIRVAIINNIILGLSISAYYFYSLFDKDWIGFIFLGSLVPLLAIKYFYTNKQLNRKHIIVNDFVVIVLTSLIFAIIGIVTKLFTLSYSTSIMFNLLFIICIIMIIYIDIFLTKRRDK